jgi:hypothetical protein
MREVRPLRVRARGHGHGRLRAIAAAGERGGGVIWNEGAVCTTVTRRIAHEGFSYHYPGQWAAYAVAEWPHQP